MSGFKIKEEVIPVVSVEQWIYALVGLVTTAVSITVFIYLNFTTRNSFEDYKQEVNHTQEMLDKRLDRIENKLDQLLTNFKNSR